MRTLHPRRPEQIADTIRRRLAEERPAEGTPLGRQSDLADEYEVSRPCLREAIKILEAEGLVTVMRGASGGVVVRDPDERITARALEGVLRHRETTYADAHEALALVEAGAARALAASERRREVASELQAVVDSGDDAGFRHALVAATGNQTMQIIAAVLDTIVAPLPTTAAKGSQAHLAALIGAGAASDAEHHWLDAMTAIASDHLGDRVTEVVELSPRPA